MDNAKNIAKNIAMFGTFSVVQNSTILFWARDHTDQQKKVGEDAIHTWFASIQKTDSKTSTTQLESRCWYHKKYPVRQRGSYTWLSARSADFSTLAKRFNLWVYEEDSTFRRWIHWGQHKTTSSIHTSAQEDMTILTWGFLQLRLYKGMILYWQLEKDIIWTSYKQSTRD